MSTIEERLQAIENEHATLKDEHATLKQTLELQAIAIGALANKATLEKLNEKYDTLFETLINHDRFTNEQLAEIRNQQTELDGKIVGLRTEMNLRLTEQNNNIINLQNIQTEHTTLLNKILERLPEKP
ncbi:MAG TPA: hypothetical protein VFN23_18300 [Ktedonobacteraceae bacterium]|nr:hypothetical protein [Ktedonobacteraceae bacterium]